MSEWIAHNGHGCPVPAGTMVDVMRLSGVVHIGIPALMFASDDSGPILLTSSLPSAWDWSQVSTDRKIIAYRLHDNGEQAKREARIASLRKMAQPNDYDVKRVTTPEREKVKQ